MASTTEFPSPALYVGDLAPDVTEAFLFDMFNRIGPVTSVRLCRDAATRKSLGYAYVNFQRPEDAESALENKNYERIRGRPCRIMRSQRDPSKRKSQLGNLFIKPLHEDVDSKILYDHFSSIGPIESVKVPYRDDSVGGALKARGYGFVQFSNPEHAQTAIHTIKAVAGHPVSVELFKSRQQRDPARQTNVFIKNVPLHFTEEQFRALFNECGPTNSVKLVAEGDNSKGFGYANFLDPDSAQRCIDKINGLKINDPAAPAPEDGTEPPALFAAFHKPKHILMRERQYQKQQGSNAKFPQGQNLYVKNLSDTVDETMLKTEFSKFGNIISCMIRREPQSKVSMGFGFVCFESPEQAEKALQEILAHTPYIFHGKPLYVALAQNKTQRAEFLRIQRMTFYAQQQQQFSMAQMQGYSAPGPYMNMPPRGDFNHGPGYFPPGPGGPPGIRPPRYGPGGPAGYGAGGPADQQQQQGGPRGGPGYGGQQGGGYQMQQGGQNRGPRTANYGGGRGGGPFPGGRRDQQQQGGQAPGPAGAGRGPPAQGAWAQQPQGPQGPGQQGPRPAPGQQQQPQQQAPPAVVQVATRPGVVNPGEIARLAPEQAKRMIGESLYPKIGHMLVDANKPRAGKITGMLLEALDNAELLNLLEDNKALDDKVAEALRVLNEAESQQ